MSEIQFSGNFYDYLPETRSAQETFRAAVQKIYNIRRTNEAVNRKLSSLQTKQNWMNFFYLLENKGSKKKWPEFREKIGLSEEEYQAYKDRKASKQEDPNPASSKTSDDNDMGVPLGSAESSRSSTKSQGRGGTGGGGESKNNQARQKRPTRSANRNALSREERYQRSNQRKAQAASKSDADSSSDDAGYETANSNDSNSNEDKDTTASEDESSTADQDASSTNMFTKAIRGGLSWFNSKFGKGDSSDKRQNDDEYKTVQAGRFLTLVDPDAPINIDEDPQYLYSFMALALLDLEYKLDDEWHTDDSTLNDEVLLRLRVLFKGSDLNVVICPDVDDGDIGVVCTIETEDERNQQPQIDPNLPVDMKRLQYLSRLVEQHFDNDGNPYWAVYLSAEHMQGEQAREYEQYQQLRKDRARQAQRVSKEHVRRIKEELKQIEGTCPAKLMQKLRLQSLDIKLRL